MIELAYPLVLLSRRARYVLPVAAALPHLGIWALQNVLFPDLILLQVIVFGSLSWLPREARGGDEASRGSPPVSSGSEPGHRRAVWVAGVMLFAFAFRLELYPLTAMQMYSSRDRSGVVEWLDMEAETECGETVDFEPDKLIPATRDGRFRWPLLFVFDRPDRGAPEALLRSLAARFEDVHAVELAEVRLRRCRWDFRQSDAKTARADIVVTWRATDPMTSTRDVDGQPCAVQ